MYDNTYDDNKMVVDDNTGVLPELKVGIIFCIVAFALATVIYMLGR